MAPEPTTAPPVASGARSPVPGSGAGDQRRGVLLVALAIGALALLVRVWAPGPVTETVDERLWMIRSHQFDTAVTHRDFRKATAWGAVPDLETITMPGVTTMWAGTAGRHLAAWGADLGLNQPPGTVVDGSPAVLRWSRAMVALACSGALAVLVWLAWRLFGRGAAIAGGLLLATEPWLAGHSDLLHTDAMVAMFGAVSVLGLAVALAPAEEAGSSGPTRRRSVFDVRAGVLVLSACAGGLALLTKLNALGVVLPGLAVVGLHDLARRLRDPRLRPRLATTATAGPPGSLGRLSARLVGSAVLWALLAALTCFVLWPALWVAPGASWHQLTDSFSEIHQLHPQLFLGQVVNDPGPRFYPVVLSYRMSPWFLLGTAAVLLLALSRIAAWLLRRRSLLQRLPRLPWLLLAAAAPYAVIISTQSNKLDRYGLPLFPFLALAVGCVAAELAQGAVRVQAPARPRVLAGLAAASGLVFASATLVEAPYQISYVDPLVGGQRGAQQRILLGWGEGTSALGEVIAAREAGRCATVTIADPSQLRVSFPCGRVVGLNPRRLDKVDYAVFHLNLQQRGIRADFERAVRRHGHLVATTRIHGVAYEQLWVIDHPA